MPDDNSASTPAQEAALALSPPLSPSKPLPLKSLKKEPTHRAFRQPGCRCRRARIDDQQNKALNPRRASFASVPAFNRVRKSLLSACSAGDFPLEESQFLKSLIRNPVLDLGLLLPPRIPQPRPYLRSSHSRIRAPSGRRTQGRHVCSDEGRRLRAGGDSRNLAGNIQAWLKHGEIPDEVSRQAGSEAARRTLWWRPGSAYWMRESGLHGMKYWKLRKPFGSVNPKFFRHKAMVSRPRELTGAVDKRTDRNGENKNANSIEPARVESEYAIWSDQVETNAAYPTIHGCAS